MHTPTHETITAGELRKFGLVTAALIILFFGLLIPWIWDLSWPVWPWVLAGVLAGVGLIRAESLRPVYRNWMRFAEMLGWFNTRLILGLIFFLIFVPVGLMVRLFRDPMRRKTDESIESYRVPSQSPKVENLEKPF